jgi:hypothetical protein
MTVDPKVIALLGFRRGRFAIARGLAAEGGWRGRPGRRQRPAPRHRHRPGARQGRARHALGKEARRLDVAIADRYTEALADADLVICAVQGEHALEAATLGRAAC